MWMEVFSSRPVTGLGWECFQAEASWRDSGACISGKCSQTTPRIKELNLCQVLSTCPLTHLILTRTWKLRTCSGSLNQRWKPEFRPWGLVCRAPQTRGSLSRTNVCKILNLEQKLGRGQVLSRRYCQLQFKGQHFLQSGRAALNNKACYQGALSCPWVTHKVGVPPARGFGAALPRKHHPRAGCAPRAGRGRSSQGVSWHPS